MSEDAHELPVPFPQVKDSRPGETPPICSMCNDTGFCIIDGSQCICVLYGHSKV